MLAARRACTKVHAMPVRAASAPAKFNSFGSPGSTADRPISPHVQIYKFPLPAVSSIMNRATGASLVGGAAVLALPLILNPAGVAAGVLAFKASAPMLVPLAKFLIAWPVTYHTASGLRHLLWDYGSRGLNSISEVDQSSRLLVLGSIALAVLLAFIRF